MRMDSSCIMHHVTTGSTCEKGFVFDRFARFRIAFHTPQLIIFCPANKFEDDFCGLTGTGKIHANLVVVGIAVNVTKYSCIFIFVSNEKRIVGNTWKV
jgi:hypothetical protein